MYDSHADISSEENYFDEDKPLYNGSRISEIKFNTQLIDLIQKEGITDQGSKNLLNLFKNVLPIDANVPSFYKMRQSLYNHPLTEHESGDFVSVGIFKQVDTVWKFYKTSILEYSNKLQQIKNSDIKHPFLDAIFIREKTFVCIMCYILH